MYAFATMTLFCKSIHTFWVSWDLTTFFYYYSIGQWRSGWKYKRHCYQKSWWQETQLWCGCWADRKSIWCSKGHNKKGWDFVRKLFSWNSLQWKLWNCKRFVNQIKAFFFHFIDLLSFHKIYMLLFRNYIGQSNLLHKSFHWIQSCRPSLLANLYLTQGFIKRSLILPLIGLIPLLYWIY